MGCAGNVVARRPLRVGPGKRGIQFLAIRKGNGGLAAKSMSCLPFVSQYITGRQRNLTKYVLQLSYMHCRKCGSRLGHKHLRPPSKIRYDKITTGVCGPMPQGQKKWPWEGTVWLPKDSLYILELWMKISKEKLKQWLM